MDAAQVINAILSGELDDSRSQISEALNARTKQVREMRTILNKAEFTAGTRVVTKGLRPQYLNGKRGTVLADTARRGKDIMVEFDANQSMGRYGYRIGVPASALVRADA